MIALQRDQTVKELMLQAAIRRGFQEYNDELIRLQQGVLGERYVDRSWHDMKLTEPYYLIHDFQTEAHQIDTIFLCQKFILIVEIKNIAGRIDFDETRHQFIRTLDNGTINSFRNPLDQVRRHRRMLQGVVSDLPILYAIVFAHPKTIIGHIPQGEPIFHCSGLEFRIRKLLTQYATQLSSIELHNLTAKLLQMHTIKKPQLHIDKTKIRTGVLCAQCQTGVKMLYHYGHFKCPKCHYKDTGILLRQAMEDYCLLIDEWITNEEFRKFVGVTSADSAKRLLKKLGFPCIGENKGRKYRISIK
ncbi:nuclease-related domain-containing protein [Bacillus ndiopicus]|uniref:nuclease-related domain-containing protein n=1 Tax=Bacillus ndiopicus TaxID=1347368 RepID=UPI0005A9AE98|nr:nuclease-related domain-containing protein [Bacillus ndiopicus]